MSDIKALLINTDGSTERLTLPRDDSLRLEALQQHVGGLIDVVHMLRDNGQCADGIINDEGKIFNLPVNELATAAMGPDDLLPGDYIAGPMVVVGVVDDHGVETSIPEDLADEIIAMEHLYRQQPAQDRDLDYGMDF